MILKEILPTIIGISQIAPPSDIRSDMLDYILSREEDDQIKGVNHPVDALHLIPEFSWLIHEVEKTVWQYLIEVGVDLNDVSLYHQRSWGVIVNKGEAIEPHTHPNANLSVVYYLQADIEQSPKEIGGGFWAAGAEIMDLGLGYLNGKFATPLGLQNWGLMPKADLVTVIPSLLLHRVEEQQTNGKRISFAFDISIMASKALGTRYEGKAPPHLSFWQEFGAESKPKPTD